MQDLTITLIQADLAWENIEKNRSQLEARLANMDDSSRLIILPEMFSTGFSMSAEALAEPPDGPTMQWMKSQAQRTNADITGSIIVRDRNRFFNRLYWVKPDGRFWQYDKAHLFRMAQENEIYQAGEERVSTEVHGWRVRPFICYDLRFPVWTRNYNLEFDLAIFIANWPERRIHHWKTLLTARAIENQCYVAGVNRIGTDGQGIQYTGDSMVIDPIGHTVCDLRSREGIESCRLSAHTLETYREKFPAWKDADRFTIER